MCFVSLMVTTKTKAYSRYTKENRRESKHRTIENNQFTKKYSKRGRREQGNCKTARNSKMAL